MQNLRQEEIYKTLTEIERRYAAGPDVRELECLSKIALIELGGWVEEKIDEILIAYIERHVKDVNEVSRIKKEVVAPVYGFEFDKNLEPLLEHVLGVAMYARIKHGLQKRGHYLNLKSVLGDLAVFRNRAAHTHWEGVSRQYRAPSTALNWLNRIYAIVMRLKAEIDKL